MEQLVEHCLPFLAGRAVWIVAAALALLSLVLAWRMGRGRRFRIPAGWLGRFGSFGLLLVGAAAIGLMLLMAGPMAPVLGQVRHLQDGIGKPAPELAFRELTSEAENRLSQTQGKVVVLTLWATWCPPCRAEMPALNKLQREYAERGLAVVTISNEERAAILKYAADHPFDTLSGYTSDLGWYGVDGRPLTLVIDRSGTIRKMMIGGQSEADVRASIEPYLSKGA